MWSPANSLQPASTTPPPKLFSDGCALINLSVHLDHHFRFGIEPCKLLVGRSNRRLRGLATIGLRLLAPCRISAGIGSGAMARRYPRSTVHGEASYWIAE